MGQYILRVLKAMLVSSVGFGGGVGLLVLIFVLTNKNEPNAFQYGLTAGVVFGLIFAFFMVAVLLPLDLSAHVFLSKGRYKQIWELEQAREFEIDGTAKEMLHASRQALLVVPYVTAVSDDVEHMLTRAVTGTSWRSPGGEELEVEINPVSAHRWKIKATSKPKGKGVVFDYGKNFENLETWMNQFLAIAQTDGPKNVLVLNQEEEPEAKAKIKSNNGDQKSS
ncbi:MAG: hypothetical protein JSS86_09730 [Cyanobacteria bacterium SZAS LIN-2]|nr:hypothetical protein [Cyanobacteria bacterium SZAS LIN-3]MBS1996580.1 hypothetical protein [Cyanobacteria bacterium SZAS LIN-2]